MTAASGFLLAASLTARPAPRVVDCRVPSWKLQASASQAPQGGIVSLTVSSDVPLMSVTLSDGKHEETLERDVAAGGRSFRGLWGVDFETTVGGRRVQARAVGLCGDAHETSWNLRVLSGRFRVEKLTVAPAFVEPPASEMERIERERAEVGRVWAAPPTARRWDAPFRLPVDAPIRPSFGARRVFNGRARSSHSGVDLAAPAGAPVAAPAPGTVALAEEMYFSGGTVILDHGGGLFTSYFHLSRIDVKVGDSLEAGDRLGAVGATGRATGPHLHWSARVNSARVNPLDLLHLPTWPAAASGRDNR